MSSLIIRKYNLVSLWDPIIWVSKSPLMPQSPCTKKSAQKIFSFQQISMTTKPSACRKINCFHTLRQSISSQSFIMWQALRAEMRRTLQLWSFPPSHHSKNLWSSQHRLSQHMMQWKGHTRTFSYDLSKMSMSFFLHIAGAPYVTTGLSFSTIKLFKFLIGERLVSSGSCWLIL